MLGKKFVIRTDHRALTWLLNWAHPNTSQYCSWIAELEVYDFTIEHREGKKHINADFVSRPLENCKQCELKHPDPKPKRNVKLLYIDEHDTSNLENRNMMRIHEDLGHIGETKLVSVVEQMGLRYKNMGKLANQVVTECLECVERKSPGNRRRKSMHYSSNKLFEKVAIDISGPLVTTKNNNRYLLSIVDIFSRLVVLVPLQNTDSSNIIKAFKQEWVSHFGFPDFIISDGAPNLNSSEVNSFCNANRIQHHITSSYHPQSNGLIERFFFTIKDMMYASAKHDHVDWDEVVWKVQLGLRASRSVATGFSPFQLTYGFLPRVSMCQRSAYSKNTSKNYRSELVKHNELIDNENNQYKHKFKVGDKVMIRSEKRKIIREKDITVLER